jgi:hypothetical protein
LLADKGRNIMAAEDDVAQKWEQVWPLIVARAWADKEFLVRLETKTEEVLREHNLPLLPGVRVALVNRDMYPGKDYPAATMCLTVPERPAGLSIDDLNNLIKNAVVASGCAGTSCCC